MSKIDIFMPYMYTSLEVLLDDAKTGRINLGIDVHLDFNTVEFKIDPEADSSETLRIWESIKNGSYNQL